MTLKGGMNLSSDTERQIVERVSEHLSVKFRDRYATSPRSYRLPEISGNRRKLPCFHPIQPALASSEILLTNDERQFVE